MALTANSFSKCAPSISTNIKQCGTVALCSAKPLTTDDLTTAYMKSGDYRVMDHLLKAEMEIKQCEAVQNGLWDFLMANKVNVSKKVVPQGVNNGLLQIAPFIKAKQTSPINNKYWLFNQGEASGDNWQIIAHSSGNVPADVRSFPEGMRVFLNGQSEGGSATRTAYSVVSATDNNDDTLTLVLSPLNSASNLDADKVTDPTNGWLTRGGNNVSDYEKECNEHPAYLTKKLVPFWVQTTRWSMCKSSKYDQYRALMLENNPLFREFGDVPDVEKNRQLAQDFQERWVNSFFWAKPLANQTLADYDELEDIESFDSTDITELGALGVDGGICVGKRAEATGVYEQLAECDRIIDAQAADVNLPALFRAFYDIIRVRDGQGNKSRVIDVFTDTVTAEAINRAMIKYYASKSADHNDQTTLRLTMDVSGFNIAKKAEFGFYYRSYPLFWPQGVTMNVLTHWYFDDELAVAEDAGIAASGRRLWILDFTGIYPGIVASNRVVHNTGELANLAKISSDFACVMKVHTRQQTLNSMTYTVIVECPSSNLVLENISGDFDITDDPAIEYSGSTTTTTPA